jgi:fatty acid desaturase
MKWLTFNIRQDPGFRFNLTDLTFILMLGAVALALGLAMPELSLYGIPLYVGFTFFLFCNVFRIGNRAEAWWYIPFGLVAIACVHTMRLEEFWWAVLIFFEPLKIGLIVQAVMHESYHGVFYRKSRVPADGRPPR